MEKKLLLEKLDSYKLMKQHIEEGILPVDIDEKIQMIEKEIEDLRAQQEDLRKSAKDVMDEDLAKVNHYIELLEMLIEEAPDDDIREEVDENESEIIEDIKEEVEETQPEEIVEDVEEEKPVSRFPQFNIGR